MGAASLFPIVAFALAWCTACASTTANSDGTSPTAAFRSETVWRKPSAGCPAGAFEADRLCAVCNPGEASGCEVRCTHGDADACALLAFRREYKRDYVHAAMLYEKACDLGSGKGCEGLARLLRFGEGLPKDDTRSADLFERMCREGRPLSCTGLAEALLAGRGRAVDAERGIRLLAGSCEQQESEACQLLKDPQLREDLDGALARARARIAACSSEPDVDACEMGQTTRVGDQRRSPGEMPLE